MNDGGPFGYWAVITQYKQVARLSQKHRARCVSLKIFAKSLRSFQITPLSEAYVGYYVPVGIFSIVIVTFLYLVPLASKIFMVEWWRDLGMG